MMNSQGVELGAPHIALFPTAGMGHLMPYLRLAATLMARSCRITLVTPSPTLTTAESSLIASFLSTYPEANHLQLHLLPDDPTPSEGQEAANNPYFLRFARISRSTHLIRPMLSSASPPLSAVISDLLSASQIAPILNDLRLPLYILSTSSAKFLALLGLLPDLLSDPARFNPSLPEVNIPGLTPLPIESIPRPFFSPDHVFTRTLATNSRALPQAKGILMNTFGEFELSTMNALNHHKVMAGLPPVLPVGPLGPYHKHPAQGPSITDADYQEWLRSQPVDSVVYICFGSKAPMGIAQIQELGKGLARSGFGFLWALMVEDPNEDIKGMLGDSVWGEINGGRGMVVSGWVDQDEVLASPAVGGFVSHCGWNSVAEAAWAGVPVLAWPHNGDQRVNAEVVEESGLGVWVKEWGMGSGRDLIREEEIGEKIGELMRDEKLRERATKIKGEARKAVEAGGSSHQTITQLLRSSALEH